MAYDTIASVYDELMSETDYDKWADYISMLLEKNHCPGKKVLDIGCGTGNITIPLSKKGYSMTGMDLSEPMLKEAEEKCQAQKQKIDWIRRDITEELPFEEGTFDAVISTFDVFSHLIDPEDLQFLLQNIKDILSEDGILIFDIQTPYKLREYLGDHTFTLHSDDVDYIWENEFDDDTEICYMTQTFFIRQDNGLYQKTVEYQEEKLYEPSMLQVWLQMFGFETVGIYGELSEAELEEEDHRAVFISRKISDDFWDEETDV